MILEFGWNFGLRELNNTTPDFKTEWFHTYLWCFSFPTRPPQSLWNIIFWFWILASYPSHKSPRKILLSTFWKFQFMVIINSRKKKPLFYLHNQEEENRMRPSAPAKMGGQGVLLGLSYRVPPQSRNSQITLCVELMSVWRIFSLLHNYFIT